MKKEICALFAAALFCPPLSSLAAPAPATPSSPAPSDPHAGHGHAQVLQQRLSTPADKASQEELNAMSEAKLKGLAAYLRALVDGKPDVEAVRASKMSLQELDRLAFLSERYYPARAKALEFEAELARLRAQPPADGSAASARALQQKVDAHERFRSQFFRQIKPESRALIDKYEAIFVAIVRDQRARAEKLRAEAEDVARKTFDETVLPRFTTYLSARARLKSEREALAAAKLDEKQVLGLSQLVTEYGRQKMTAQKAAEELPAARQRLKSAQVGGRATSFEERLIQHCEAQLAEFEKFKVRFAEKNGEKMQAAIEANFEALMQAYQHRAEQPAASAR